VSTPEPAFLARDGEIRRPNTTRFDDGKLDRHGGKSLACRESDVVRKYKCSS
jgi:hypothetical protein